MAPIAFTRARPNRVWDLRMPYHMYYKRRARAARSGAGCALSSRLPLRRCGELLAAPWPPHTKRNRRRSLNSCLYPEAAAASVTAAASGAVGGGGGSSFRLRASSSSQQPQLWSTAPAAAAVAATAAAATAAAAAASGQHQRQQHLQMQ
ncbi:hypothetical protein PLESTM_000859700 [Pleodorina starrii]|nr:hypothetical protein PLESTM_000859700 [Pleodorina starrii]